MSGVVLPRKNGATHINVDRAPQPRSYRVSGPGLCDLFSLDCREHKFSETRIQQLVSLCDRIGAKCPLAPVL